MMVGKRIDGRSGHDAMDILELPLGEVGGRTNIGSTTEEDAADTRAWITGLRMEMRRALTMAVGAL